MSDRKLNDGIVYLHGRPDAHPLHKAFANSVTANHFHVDAPIRWQDKNFHPVILIFIWIFNALLFPFKKYSVYLIDNLHVSVILFKKFFSFRKRKFIVHLGSHTLYFMKTGRFGRLNLILHKWALSKYDALICEGEMAQRLAKDLLGDKCPPTYVTFLGPLASRTQLLHKVNPDLNSHNILIMASGPDMFRLHYKGLDLMLRSFSDLLEICPDARLFIMGRWTKEQLYEYAPAELFNGNEPKIVLLGYVNDITEVLAKMSLCIHLSRGDAFPTATIEAMSAGIPVIMSNVTGTQDIVASVDISFVLPLDENELKNKISNYFQLKIDEKKSLSDSFRKAAEPFTEENAVAHYKRTFSSVLDSLENRSV
ncbi:MAG: glycosyltransferase [Bacteroidota bacterium]